MKILLVTSEALPYIKSGGLADFIYSFGKALKDKGHEVSVIRPLYKAIRDRHQEVLTDLYDTYDFKMDWRTQGCGVFHHRIDDIDFYFTAMDRFDRDGMYGYGCTYYGNGYAAQQPYAQQSQQPPYQQPYAQQPAYGQQPYYANNYIPDAFFSSLTPAEKDEFDRLFISRIYGDNKRLPAYRIGGDNREFFTKVFVFMGRYRNVISDGLLEKIYNYSNSIR